MKLDEALQANLQGRREANLYRTRRLLASPQQPTVTVDGRRLVSFCSNDYLGLANHPRVIEAFRRAAEQYGVGSGSAHLVCGHSVEHHALEEELADFTGRQRALLYSTGYMANLGIVGALLGRGDAVLEDKLNHASLLDAGLLSGARFQRFQHNNLDHLSRCLERTEAKRTLLAVDGVFSMDGDLAPLAAYAGLAETHNAWLMVDDAHGFGCIGAGGGGCAEHVGLTNDQLPILMGTLGKAFGTFGAFVAGSDALIETLIQFSRTYIYTTALPPAVAAASRVSLALVREEAWRRTHLQTLIQQFRAGAESLGLALMDSPTPIQPVVLGDPAVALAVSRALEAKGFLVSAIRPPTVPAGTARLRVTLSAAHSEQQVESLLEALSSAVAVHHREPGA